MERNRMYLMSEDERSSSATALFAPRKEGHVTRKPVRQPGSLELIDLGDKRSEKERPPSESSCRSWSRASVGSVPPRSDSSLSRRTMTPTKQISLQAVRRKEESSDPFVDDVDIDLDSLGFDGGRRRRKQFLDEDGFRPLSENSFVEDEFMDSGETADYNRSSNSLLAAENDATEIHSLKPLENPVEDVPEKRLSFQEESFHKGEEAKKEESSSDSDDDNEDEEGKVKLRAPNELLMEFVDCLMKKDFPNAEKLCKMILLYEPENPEALKFKPLIEEKLKLDAEAAAEEEGDSDDEDDDEDDDSDDDDEDDDSDDDDDDTSGSDEDSSEDKDEDEAAIPTSSGNVPSTSAQRQASKDIKGANTVRTWKPAS